MCELGLCEVQVCVRFWCVPGANSCVMLARARGKFVRAVRAVRVSGGRVCV